MLLGYVSDERYMAIADALVVTYVASMPVDLAVSRVTANVPDRLLAGGTADASPSAP